MASSKGSPGPHDRKAGTPRAHCIRQVTRGGQARRRCKRYAAAGSKLCKFHKEQAANEITKESLANEEKRRNPAFKANGADAGPTPSQSSRNGLDTTLKKDVKAILARQPTSQPPKSKDITRFVINEQAARALNRLGYDPDEMFDPKQTLLAAVKSAHDQRVVWEAMLSSIDPADYDFLGEMPIPGLKNTAKGARIDVIQRHLEETTKNAAKISKMAIDAGIEERLVRLAEEQSALIADTVRAGVLAAVTAVALAVRASPSQQQAALDAGLQGAATHLRALAAGTAAPEVIDGVAKRV